MGLFDKLKNVFIDEEEEEIIPQITKIEETKEEKSEIKIETPPKEKIPVSENTFSDRELIDVSEKFKFPIIFEEDDFKEERKKTKSINVLEKEHNKYEPDVKKEIKSAKKTFKPSPVISPVYGVLDKNYSKEDITTKDGLLNDYDAKVDIDYVMNKAYGEVKTREEKNKMELGNKPIDLFEEHTSVVEVEVENTNDEIDEKIKSIDELLKDTTDDDFYSLVDSMYKDDEGDEENQEPLQRTRTPEITDHSFVDRLSKQRGCHCADANRNREGSSRFSTFPADLGSLFHDGQNRGRHHLQKSDADRLQRSHPHDQHGRNHDPAASDPPVSPRHHPDETDHRADNPDQITH